jgi:hypothetical protein
VIFSELIERGMIPPGTMLGGRLVAATDIRRGAAGRAKARQRAKHPCGHAAKCGLPIACATTPINQHGCRVSRAASHAPFRPYFRA